MFELSDNGKASENPIEFRINERIASIEKSKAGLFQQIREYDKEIATLKAVLNPVPESSARKIAKAIKPKSEAPTEPITASAPSISS